MEEFKFLDVLLNYGALGAITILAIFVAIRKDMQLTRERAEHHKELLDLVSKHNDAKLALEERYITKSESWVSKYQDLAQAQDSTIKALKAFVDSK